MPPAGSAEFMRCRARRRTPAAVHRVVATLRTRRTADERVHARAAEMASAGLCGPARRMGGTAAGSAGRIVSVEAGAAGGRPVFFSIAGSVEPSSRDPRRGARLGFERVIGTAAGFILPGLMLIGPLLARRNVKLGRGDRRGAFRAAAVVFFLIMLAWLLGEPRRVRQHRKSAVCSTRSAWRSGIPRCSG